MDVRTPILLVTDGKSSVLYGDRRKIQAHVVEQVTIGSVEGELMAEALVYETLPLRYRDLYCAGNLLAMVTPRILRPSDLVAADCERKLLAAIRKLATTNETERTVYI